MNKIFFKNNEEQKLQVIRSRLGHNQVQCKFYHNFVRTVAVKIRGTFRHLDCCYIGSQVNKLSNNWAVVLL